METTLLVGDHLLVNKFIFGGHGAWYEKLLPYRPIERGDIIVFKYPYQDHTHYVKRVIGLPGDHLKIVDQRVFINGKVLNEPYVTHDPNVGYDPLNYNFPPTGRSVVFVADGSRVGDATLRNMCRAMRLSCRRRSILRWATTATIVRTAATGDLWIATRSWGGHF